MSKWKFNTEKPMEGYKIEFIVKGLNIPEVGIWQNGEIKGTDMTWRWEAVRLWCYVSPPRGENND